MVDPNALPEFTPEVRDRIWSKVEAVLRGRGRYDVFELIVESNVPPLPDIDADWRTRAGQTLAQPPSNQARRERAEGGHPERDGLVFGSRAERAVYDALVSLQRESPQERTFAIVPSAGVKLRDAGVRTPDFLVIGNGRALVIEVDGRHHYDAQGRRRRPGPALVPLRRLHRAHRRSAHRGRDRAGEAAS